MSSDNGFEMADRTVNDVSRISLGAERGASNLMRDVESVREDSGADSRLFNDYDQSVASRLEKNGTLPMLSLGYAKNNFDHLDMDGSGEITRDELMLARDHAGSRTEERMLSILSTNFHDVRSAHESNKYIPWAGDKKGITLDDLNAKLKEGEKRMDDSAANFEKIERGFYVESIASDLIADRGAGFARLARAQKGGSDQEITKGDLDSLIEQDDRKREFGSRELPLRDRKAAEYLSKNWDSPEVAKLRVDAVTYTDGTGREYKDKGGITMQSLEKGLIGFDPNEEQAVSRTTVTERRLPSGDEQVVSTTTVSERRLSDAEVVLNDSKRLTDEDAARSKIAGRLSFEQHESIDGGAEIAPERSWQSFENLSKESEFDMDASHEFVEWKVQKGQYLWMIAEQSLIETGNCKPSVREINDMTNAIASENRIHRNDYLRVGQRLRIPQMRYGSR